MLSKLISMLLRLMVYHHKNSTIFQRETPGRVAQSVGHLTRKSDTRSGNILSFLLPLFKEGQLSVTGESMCTKYW